MLIPVLAVTSLLLTGQVDTIALSVDLAADSIYIDEHTVATVTVRSHGGRLDFTPLEDIPLRNLSITGASHHRSRSTDPNGTVYTEQFSFTVHPNELGMGYLEPLILTGYTASETGPFRLFTPQVGLLIRPRPRPPDYLHPAAAGIAVAASLLLLFLLYRRQRRQVVRIEEHDELQAVAPRYLAQLDALPAGSDIGTSLEQTLREFLMAYYRPIRPLATIAATRDFLHQQGITRLDRVLDELEQMQFANTTTAETVAMLRMRIKNFIREYQGGNHESGN